MRVLVCGGREYNDEETLMNFLDKVHQTIQITTLIHGHAKGADTLGELWAKLNEIPSLGFRANWTKHGKAAGHIRNTKMLKEGRPDVVIAFPGGKGTKNMMDQTTKNNVPLIVVNDNGTFFDSHDLIKT
tara:strand:+ start:816 stop:1202 length:387 start_codon:yes stop_codon:yes gene_type:complete